MADNRTRWKAIIASSWHLILTTAPARKLYYLREYWRADTLSQGLLIPGRARWRLQVRVGAPAHALLESPVRNIALG